MCVRCDVALGVTTPADSRAHRSGLSAALPDNTAKADMACRCIDRLRMTRGWPVPPAVVRRAQMRTALQHLARDANLGLHRVVTAGFSCAARIGRDAACLAGIRFMPGRKPVGRPLPD